MAIRSLDDSQPIRYADVMTPFVAERGHRHRHSFVYIHVAWWWVVIRFVAEHRHSFTG
jgi:hypothetical protein